jgi:hypothetical protein
MQASGTTGRPKIGENPDLKTSSKQQQNPHQKTLNIHASNLAHAYLPYKWMWVSSTKERPKIGENPQLQTSLK